MNLPAVDLTWEVEGGAGEQSWPKRLGKQRPEGFWSQSGGGNNWEQNPSSEG